MVYVPVVEKQILWSKRCKDKALVGTVKETVMQVSRSKKWAYYLNKKKKSNKSGYPDEAIKSLARCFYPSMMDFFNSEEGQREYEEWLKEQEALQALPVAA